MPAKGLALASPAPPPSCTLRVLQGSRGAREGELGTGGSSERGAGDQWQRLAGAGPEGAGDGQGAPPAQCRIPGGSPGPPGPRPAREQGPACPQTSVPLSSLLLPPPTGWTPESQETGELVTR